MPKMLEQYDPISWESDKVTDLRYKMKALQILGEHIRDLISDPKLPYVDNFTGEMLSLLGFEMSLAAMQRLTERRLDSVRKNKK